MSFDAMRPQSSAFLRTVLNRWMSKQNLLRSLMTASRLAVEVAFPRKSWKTA